jgi:hypothetical protein
MNRTRQSRLTKLELSLQASSTGPLFLLANYPVEDVDDIFAHWPELVAAGRASVHGSTLCLTDVKPTDPDGWELRWGR